MTKLHYNWQRFDQDMVKLALNIYQSNWRPDLIVGISRGGCVPAVTLSHIMKVPMRPLHVSLRDHAYTISDCELAEQAFGYVPREERSQYSQADGFWEEDWHPAAVQNILVVDEINDSGATLNWILQDWPSSCLPNHSRWNQVWNHNVRFAVLWNNEASEFQNIDYAINTINKAEQDVWIHFPWEGAA